jgi:hypothetical protein
MRGKPLHPIAEIFLLDRIVELHFQVSLFYGGLRRKSEYGGFIGGGDCSEASQHHCERGSHFHMHIL